MFLLLPLLFPATVATDATATTANFAATAAVVTSATAANALTARTATTAAATAVTAAPAPLRNVGAASGRTGRRCLLHVHSTTGLKVDLLSPPLVYLEGGGSCS